MNNRLVQMWEEEVIIPTYEVSAPEKNPMFFEKRVYQGSSGAVYPYPIIERIYDEKTDKKYDAVFLENQYIKLMVLPQLGGRIQMAFDKIANRHFIYYNEVIKPALVGLCGPWISGGIEFNWPQHHRPSTFEPVDYALEENEDGSKTIWVNEVEKMNRTKGMAGFTLYPDKAYIEIKVKLFNRTPLPQTFLWWANPAVNVDEHYQSIFPPDVHAVYDHGRRAVSGFPIAKGVYYKVDYAPGTDISRYSNIPVPTSYMAVNSAYDFLGGYEHDTNAGILHIANHHIAPGKKQWTWGCGDFGKAWDCNLTDANGPYVELMTGVFTDNQPDFSWIMPYEEKSFSQYFLPYRDLGIIKNASKDLLLHFSLEKDKGVLKLFATSHMPQLQITIAYKGETIHSLVANIVPEAISNFDFTIPNTAQESDFNIVVHNENQMELLQYQLAENSTEHLPEAAKAPASPEATTTNEMLYLTGLHLEQYRHATYNPVNYYEEALQRDAGDVRCNNALGLWYLRRGQIKKSEPYFRKVIETLTQFNANPYNGEPYYNLGLCLQWQHRTEEAYAAFYKATWNSAFKSNSFFALAQIDMANKQYQTALEHVEQAIYGNAGNNKAAVLKAVALRKLSRVEEALSFCNEVLSRDVFNLPLYFEKSWLYQCNNQNEKAGEELQKAYELSRGDAHHFIECAIEYSAAGLYEEAINCLQYFLSRADDNSYSMVLYYLGWNYHQTGNKTEATAYFKKALLAKDDHYFPNRIEDIEVLEKAMQYYATDYKAAYYLGCLWYDKRNYFTAIDLWERTLEINDAFPAAHRNLGIAYFNKVNDDKLALQHLEKAFSLDTTDARILMELDQLYKRLNKTPDERLQFLEQYLPLVESRDDLYLERIAMYNYLGAYEKAYELLMARKFHPWEGGEGKAPAQYKCSLIQMAKKLISKQNYEAALHYLELAQNYPENLGEGKLCGTPENEIFYWMGRAHKGLQQTEKAAVFFQKATHGLSQPSAAIFYNDPQPDSIFYQGLSWGELNCPEKANTIFSALMHYGEVHVNDKVEIDYFAVSLPDLMVFDDNLSKRNKVHCLYMMGLGNLGLKKFTIAQALFNEVFGMDAMHLGARIHAALSRCRNRKK